MKSRGLRHTIGIGAFLIGLVLALPGPAAATGFIYSRPYTPFTHGFQQHQFRHFGYYRPYFFRGHRGFLHRQYHFDYGSRFYHPGFSYPQGFYGGSRTIFIWR
jgi:hypothetical protein